MVMGLLERGLMMRGVAEEMERASRFGRWFCETSHRIREQNA